MARNRWPRAALSDRRRGIGLGHRQQTHEEGRGDQRHHHEHAEGGQQPSQHGVGQAGRRAVTLVRGHQRRHHHRLHGARREQLEQDVGHQVGGLVDVAQRRGAEHRGHHQDAGETADPRDQRQPGDRGREAADGLLRCARAERHLVGEVAGVAHERPAGQQGVGSVAQAVVADLPVRQPGQAQDERAEAGEVVDVVHGGDMVADLAVVAHRGDDAVCLLALTEGLLQPGVGGHRHRPGIGGEASPGAAAGRASGRGPRVSPPTTASSR